MRIGGGGSGGGGSRRWPVISAAALRRKLLESIACGRSNSSGLRFKKRDTFEKPKPKPKPKCRRVNGSDRLSELLKLDISDSGSDEPESETRRKVEAFKVLENAVKKLQSESSDLKREAAKEVRSLAKDDVDARETLSMLGSIPPLISMLDCDDVDGQISSLYALLNLGIGNDINKAAIVKAGGIEKLMKLLESNNALIYEAIVANFLGLSALDMNKPIIASSGAIPFLIKSFRFPISSQCKQDSLRALFNLSILPSNVPQLVVKSDLVAQLMYTLEDSPDRILSVLSNLVSASEGRMAISKCNDGIAILIDVLSWTDSPSCQEKAAYVLMVMAYKSEFDRAVMIKCGIRSVLLELVLMGSALAQKRGSRLLEILRAERGKEVSEGFLGLHAASAPPVMGGEEEEEEVVSEETKAVRELVKESLQSNLKRIVKRANLMRDQGEKKGFKVGTWTSKSVPF